MTFSPLIREAPADSSIAFRASVYRRGDQGEMLRDVVALANAPAVGRRFLFIGVDDKPGRERRFPGVSVRSWNTFREAAANYLARTVEPALAITFDSMEVGDRVVGVLCLDACEDPPYLLSRRVGSQPAGGGWQRNGTRTRRLLRKDLQRIFEARFRRHEIGDIAVGFPGDLPREEISLPVLPLDKLPSKVAIRKFEKLLDAKRVSKSVLGRSDSRIARLVHAQVSGGTTPYRDQSTRTLRVLLAHAPLEHAAADDHYRYELRAHRLNLLLNNFADDAQRDLTLTLKFPRQDGLDIPPRLYGAPDAPTPRSSGYPKVDAGPRTIAVRTTGLNIPSRGSIEAFNEPLRLCLGEEMAGRTIRVAYTLQGGSLPRPVQGRLKILVDAVSP